MLPKKFILLHSNIRKNHGIIFNTDDIITIESDGLESQITFSCGNNSIDKIWVNESPEEIYKMIYKSDEKEQTKC